MDESILIRRAQNGDTAAWEPLVLAHQEAVFRYAYLLLGDPDDAEDVAQETFLRAWRYLGRFDLARSLRPWLLSIASNLASNRRRSIGRYLSALTRALREEPAPPTLEEKSAQRMQAGQLREAIQTLNTTDRQIVYLRYFLDLSVAETAEALDIPQGTVKSRLSRALEKLRAIVQDDFPSLADSREGQGP